MSKHSSCSRTWGRGSAEDGDDQNKLMFNPWRGIPQRTPNGHTGICGTCFRKRPSDSGVSCISPAPTNSSMTMSIIPINNNNNNNYKYNNNTLIIMEMQLLCLSQEMRLLRL